LPWVTTTGCNKSDSSPYRTIETNLLHTGKC